MNTRTVTVSAGAPAVQLVAPRDDGYVETVTIAAPSVAVVDAVLYVGGPDVSSSNGIPIPEMGNAPVPVGPGGVWAISTGGDVSVRIATP